MGFDLVAKDAKHFGERLTHRRLVIDDENGCSVLAHAGSTDLNGTVIRNSVASAPVASSQIRPPWAAAIDPQIDRPRPSPSGFEVVSGSNKRATMSADTPGPLSQTLISRSDGRTARCAASRIRPPRMFAPA